MNLKLLPFVLLFILGSVLIYESINDTPTYDEPANMAAAYDYVYRNDYRIYPDNPPLVKILSGLFLLPFKNQVRFPQNSQYYSEPKTFDLYTYGTEFLYKSGNYAKKIIFLTRLPNILFTIGLGILLFIFAKKLYGPKAGWLALTLYSLDPNIRGHGHILAFDIPLTFFILLSLYLFYVYYREISCHSEPDRNRVKNPVRLSENAEDPSSREAGLRMTTYMILLILIFIFALGFLTKFTFVFFAIPFLAGIILLLLIKKSWSIKSVLIIVSTLIISSFSLIWLFGLSTGYNSKNFDYDQVPIIESANNKLRNNFTWNLLKSLPLPYYYKTGMQVMYTHNIVSQPAYLLGEVRAKNDWFFYFPVSFILKTPIPTLIIISLTLILACYYVLPRRQAGLKHSNKKIRISTKTYAPFLFGGFYFASLMLFSHINNVYRYLFPSLILFILGSSQIINIINIRDIKVKFAGFFLIFYLLASSLFSFPYDLSYINELTGIPPKGYKYLSDSEIDWGQDLSRLAIWLKNNNLINETITLSYLGTADPQYYGIKYKPLRFEDLNRLSGIVAVSAANLTLGDWQIKSSSDYKLGFIKQAPLDALREKKPEAVIGKSIFVYKY